MRTPQSLLFGPRLAPSLRKLGPFVGDFGEAEVCRLVHLRGHDWAEREALRLIDRGHDYSAAMLRAAVVLGGRRQASVLTPTGQFICEQACADIPSTANSDSYLPPQIHNQLIAYLFPGLPGVKTVANFCRSLDQPPVPSLLALTAELIEDEFDRDDLYTEVMRRRSVRAFKRRGDDLVVAGRWMRERPDHDCDPLWWPAVVKAAAQRSAQPEIGQASLTNPRLAQLFAAELGGDGLGLADLLARAYNSETPA